MLSIIPKSDTPKYMLLSAIVSLVLTVMLGVTIYKSKDAQAYNRGNIMSNMVYLDKNSMTESQIQKFLESKKSKLATYKDQGPNETKKERAAYLIWHAAQIWGINPQVILATLQKESSLITKQNPETWRFNSAMGYACPDDGGCGSVVGFAKQVNMATYQFRYNYEALKYNSSFTDIDGDSHPVGAFACNGKTRFYSKALRPGNKVKFYGASGKKDRTITIANEATASFLCYTPHIGPFNETGYSGSDNLVSNFSAWFGPLQGYSNVANERWMQLKYDTAKFSTTTQDTIGKVYPKGTQILIKSKVKLDGALYIRSQYDDSRNNDQGFRYSDLEPLSLNFEKLEVPRWLRVKSNIKLTDPETDKFVGGTIKAGTRVFFPYKAYRDGELFLRSNSESKKNSSYVIPYSSLEETTLSFVPFDVPRYMRVNKSVNLMDVDKGLDSTNITLNKSDAYFDQKIKINGKWYYRTNADSKNSKPYVVNSNNISQIEYKKIKKPINMSLNVNYAKVTPRNNKTADQGPLSKGTVLTYDSYIVVNDVKYLRSEYDTKHGLDRAIPMGNLTPAFQSLERPRNFSMKTDLQKMNAFTGVHLEETWPKGTTRFYPTKIKLDGKWYLRSEYDTTRNNADVLPLSKLK